MNHWYVQERLAREQHLDREREAEGVRRARLARGTGPTVGVVARIGAWVAARLPRTGPRWPRRHGHRGVRRAHRPV